MSAHPRLAAILFVLAIWLALYALAGPAAVAFVAAVSGLTAIGIVLLDAKESRR